MLALRVRIDAFERCMRRQADRKTIELGGKTSLAVLYNFYFLSGSAESTWFATLWATAVGAFVGAAVAFAIDWMRRAREEMRRRIAAGNVALLTLNAMWFELFTYERDVVHKAIENADTSPLPLWLSIPKAVMRESGYTFDIADLSFLLQSPEAEVVADLILQQDRSRSFLHGLTMRDSVLDRAHEQMNARGVGLKCIPSDQELVEIIGPRETGQLRTMTCGMLQNLYQTLFEMHDYSNRLQAALKRQLGEKNVRSFPIPDLAADLEPSAEEWVRSAVEKCKSRPSASAET